MFFLFSLVCCCCCAFCVGRRLAPRCIFHSAFGISGSGFKRPDRICSFLNELFDRRDTQVSLRWCTVIAARLSFVGRGCGAFCGGWFRSYVRTAYILSTMVIRTYRLRFFCREGIPRDFSRGILSPAVLCGILRDSSG